MMRLELEAVRLRLWPIPLAGALMQGILFVGREAARWVYRNGPAAFEGHPSIFLLLAIAFQALLGLVGILVMKRTLPAADAHLRWPPGRTYVGWAALIGIAMGLIMLVADYWPELLRRAPLNESYTKHPLDAVWFLVGMLSTGLAEETIFRGLLVGMLVVLTPGRIRVGRIDLPVAGVIVAVLFGLAHWESFVVDPLHAALAQQAYAFIWGLTYVWLMERSRSLLAPIVAHGAGNFVEVALVMMLTEAFRS